MLYKYVLSWVGAANIATVIVLTFLVTLTIALGIRAGEGAWGLLAHRSRPDTPDHIDLAYEELCRNPE